MPSRSRLMKLRVRCAAAWRKLQITFSSNAISRIGSGGRWVSKCPTMPMCGDCTHTVLRPPFLRRRHPRSFCYSAGTSGCIETPLPSGNYAPVCRSFLRCVGMLLACGKLGSKRGVVMTLPNGSRALAMSVLSCAPLSVIPSPLPDKA